MIRQSLGSIKVLFLIALVVLFSYLILYLTLGFNYLDAFLYASSLENPQGFMLLSDPVNYFVTRIQDVLDILVFFGPVLCALAFLGIKELKQDHDAGASDRSPYIMAVSAMVALILLFLTGAPKKGETARICMFVLPFLLMPVLSYLTRHNVSYKRRVLLLIVVFVQAVIMQLLVSWIW